MADAAAVMCFQKAQIVYVVDFGVVAQKLSHFGRIAGLFLHAQRECLQAAHEQPARPGISHISQEATQFLDLPDQVL